MVAYPDDVISELERRATSIRRHIIRMTRAAGSGHPGGSLSSTDIISALFFKVMHHHPTDPSWEDRDRFVLSKGHAAPAYYAALAESGYFSTDELLSLRKLGSRLQGHPSRGKLPGVEMSTGSLGQGLSTALGMALAAKLDRKAYRVYCLCGDGEQQSGQIWEAAMLGAHYELDNITTFLDRNKLQIDGPTEKIMSLEPLADKWKAFGWNVIEIDGHNLREIARGLRQGQGGAQPAHLGPGPHGQGQGRELHGERPLVPRQGAERRGDQEGAARAGGRHMKFQYASQRKEYGRALVDLGKSRKDVVVLDADLSSSTRTADFAKEFPEHFFNCGIAEQNMMGVAAGMAASGKVVFA